MSIASRDEIINELKSRIKLLDKQKGGAEQHLREKLLLSVISDSVDQAKDTESLFLRVLERLSVVLDVPLGACCEIVDKKLFPLEIYNFPDREDSSNCGFKISSKLAADLKSGPLLIQHGSAQYEDISFTDDFSSPPKLIALFPFQSLYIPFGCFVFFEYEKKKTQLASLSLVIQHLIRISIEKYEKLKLTEELKELNRSFEEKLGQRTEALSTRIKNLEEDVKKAEKLAKPVKVQQKVVKKAQKDLSYAFLKNVGVEIRTPLNGILGFAELMRGNNMPENELDNYIDIIKSCGKSLMKIVDDAQVYAAIKSGFVKTEKTEFLLAPFMSALYDDYKKDELFRQRDHVELKINININGSTEIEADQDKLKLVLTNLLGNAIKFTGEGYIEFGCSVEDPKGRLKQKTKPDVVFFVKDSGIGIKKEHQDLVFDEFYKVEHEISKLYGGLGLGLTIAKSLVELMGGKIWFESSPDEGTSFYFTIPKSIKLSQAEIDALNGNGEESHFDWASKNILIVEDDSMSVIYLKEALKASGANILIAGNGNAAVELMASGESVDLILMDIKLPGISGFEATKLIKEFSTVPIIAQTAYAMADDYKKIIQVGCDDYVSKPINRRKLLKKINNLFAQNNPALSS